jgi:hypothetical protein
VGRGVSLQATHLPHFYFVLINLFNYLLERFPAGDGNFSLHYRFENGSGTHPASYPMGTRALSLGVKRQGREADHSPPSSAEVKE